MGGNMGNITDYNFVAMTKETLKHHLHDAVYNEIMDSMVKDFIENAGPLVREQVKKVTLDEVSCVKDMALVRDELVVHLQWKDGDS